MLRLLTFGSLRVLRDDGSTSDLANQRRRLAVLAIVSSAAPAGVSRERLIFLLWPDSDADKGRHALNQIVYNLRRELGTSPIDGVAELSLVPDVMSSDLIDFRAAIARGDHALAAELYRGPFLDGFFVPGATEFERWAEDERVRTLRQAMSAMDKLTAAAEAAGDAAGLVHWTQRLVELDPLSARRALTHMRALAAQGDRDGAIAYGRRYDALARADGDDVDPAVAAEVERLRTLPTTIPASITATPVPGAPAIAQAAEAPAPVSDAESRQTPEPALAATVRPRSARSRWRVPAMVVGALVAVVSGIAWMRDSATPLPLQRGDRLLVAEVQLPAADTANARAMSYALQSALQQSSRVHIVSPASISEALRRMGRTAVTTPLTDSVAAEVAEREGARFVVSLMIAPASPADARVVTLRVIEPSSRATLRNYTSSATTSTLLDAIDVVAGRLRRDLGDSRSDVSGAIPLPRATTPSIEALRLLAGAQRAANQASYRDAQALYEGALALDSGFAAAHSGLANLAYINNNPREGDAHMSRALALANRLPPRERLLIEATGARGANEWMRAATLHRAYLIRFPDDYDVYASLGYDLMRAHVPRDAAAAFDTLKAHRSLSVGDYMNVSQIRTLLDDPAGAHAAHVAAIRLDSAVLRKVTYNEQIGDALLALGLADSARAVHGLLLTREAMDRARGHRAMAYVDLYEGRYTSAVAHLREAVEIDAVSPSLSLSEVRDRALLAATLMDLGQVAAAREQLQAAARLCLTRPIAPQAILWTGKPLARLGERSLVRSLLDSARARARPTAKQEQSSVAVLEAELQMADGAAALAIASADRALALDDSMPYTLDTKGHAQERSGALAEARTTYNRLAGQLRRSLESEGQQKARLAPLAVIRLDAQLGSTDAARAQLAQFSAQWPRADAGLPFVTSLHQQLARVVPR